MEVKFDNFGRHPRAKHPRMIEIKIMLQMPDSIHCRFYIIKYGCKIIINIISIYMQGTLEFLI